MITDFHQRERISFLLQVLSRVVHHITDINYIQNSTQIPLSRRQFEILKILYVSGSFSVSDLARFILVSRPAASKSVDNLVKHALVSRTTPDQDRRKAIVSILPAGEEIIQHYFEQLNQINTKHLSHFSGPELDNFEQVLQSYVEMLVRNYKDDIELICLSCNTKFSDLCPMVEEGRLSCYHTIVDA